MSTQELFPNRVNMTRRRLRLSLAPFSQTQCLRVVAAALLREVAEVVPLSDPRAQLPEMRVVEAYRCVMWTAVALAVAAALTAIAWLGDDPPEHRGAN
jgi:hypothetical protein